MHNFYFIVPSFLRSDNAFERSFAYTFKNLVQQENELTELFLYLMPES